MIPITYIGKRKHYIDGCYGSCIRFTQGETISVDDDLGKKLLRHKDQYKEGGRPVKESVNKERVIEDPEQNDRDAVSNMDKEALLEYAATHFSGYKLDSRKGEVKLRDEVIQLIDRFGLE